MSSNLDCVYVAASAHDARYTRICIASIRYFYPDIPIKLLAGGLLEPGLLEELSTYWDVELADFPGGDWGWGFIKLEPLFGPTGDRFMVLDSDTVLAGCVLDYWDSADADFLVDDEDIDERDMHRLYYDWQKVSLFDSDAQPPKFVFNTGQWFGTAGVLTREDFSHLLDWSTMPPTLLMKNCSHPSDQGILNYVLNQKMHKGEISVERCKLMLWPGHSMAGWNKKTISSRQADPRVIHWAGMKQPTISTMVGSDILQFFESQYYQAIPNGSRKYFSNKLKYPLSNYAKIATTQITLKLQSLTSLS